MDDAQYTAEMRKISEWLIEVLSDGTDRQLIVTYIILRALTNLSNSAYKARHNFSDKDDGQTDPSVHAIVHELFGSIQDAFERTGLADKLEAAIEAADTKSQDTLFQKMAEHQQPN
jgi:hypothetical protein